MGTRHQHAFTLTELLIALALIGIILTAVVSVNISTARASAALQARNELLAETQVAQNYMLSKLKQAAYVYPSGSTLQLTSSEQTTRNPAGGYSWTIGTDPMVAFVLPPRNGSNVSACPVSGPSDPDNCYSFYAFYAIRRSDLTTATGAATLTDNPGADALNDPASWVLMEYRAGYSGRGFGYSGGSPPSYPTGLPGHLVLDYVLPPAAGSADRLFTVTAPATGPQMTGLTSVLLRLAVQRQVVGQTLQMPATGRYAQTAFPRNVGKPIIEN